MIDDKDLNAVSQRVRREVSDDVFENLSDILFDKVNLLNQPALTTSTDVTSTTTYGMLFRAIDTSGNKYIRPDKKSRFRMNFYFTDNMAETEAYILSPAVHLTTSAPAYPLDMDSYVGVKIIDTVLYLVAMDSGNEKVIPTSVRIIDDATNILEIFYNVTHAEIMFNGKSLGSISCNLTKNLNDIQTVYPVICPIRSGDGSTVKLTAETFQFLQDR